LLKAGDWLVIITCFSFVHQINTSISLGNVKPSCSLKKLIENENGIGFDGANTYLYTPNERYCSKDWSLDKIKKIN